MLSGEGADEIFGGYNIYHNPADMASYFKIPRPIRKAVGAVAEKLPHKHGINYLVVLFVLAKAYSKGLVNVGNSGNIA